MPQLSAYCRFVSQDLALRGQGGNRNFVFGKQSHVSLGLFEICIPVGYLHYLKLVGNMVDINVPLLLEIYIMSEYRIVFDVADGLFLSKRYGWKLSLHRKRGHLYLNWKSSALYASSELTKIRRRFFHAHTDRVFDPMKRAEHAEATPRTHCALKDVCRTCDICQRLPKAPSRFRVALPNEDVIFNRTVYMDLMKLDGNSKLHIRDKDTLFSADAFLTEGETADDVCNVHMRSWVIPYVGFSEIVHCDQGPQFTPGRWKSLLLKPGIRQDDSRVESHIALGAGEKFRQIYRNVRADHPKVAHDNALSLLVKSMKEIAGPSELCLRLLVFGVLPRMPLATKDLPEKRERMNAMTTASSEMVKHAARARLSTARRIYVPGAAYSEIEAECDVLV